MSVSAQRQAPLREGLDDLVDRLLAEVRDRGELALRLRHEVADRLDAGTLEAVVAAHAELELLDEDVVHRAAAALTATRGERVRAAGAVVELQAGRLAQVLDAVLVGEDREARDEDLGCLAQRGLRVDRAVGLDVERQLVVVGALATRACSTAYATRRTGEKIESIGMTPIGWSGDLLSSDGR